MLKLNHPLQVQCKNFLEWVITPKNTTPNQPTNTNPTSNRHKKPQNEKHDIIHQQITAAKGLFHPKPSFHQHHCVSGWLDPTRHLRHVVEPRRTRFHQDRSKAHLEETQTQHCWPITQSRRGRSTPRKPKTSTSTSWFFFNKWNEGNIRSKISAQGIGTMVCFWQHHNLSWIGKTVFSRTLFRSSREVECYSRAITQCFLRTSLGEIQRILSGKLHHGCNDGSNRWDCSYRFTRIHFSKQNIIIRIIKSQESNQPQTKACGVWFECSSQAAKKIKFSNATLHLLRYSLTRVFQMNTLGVNPSHDPL